ncbi:MAG TPA: class I SAM-dependent methyltransferase [Streptosporangiaceae bacterium]
MDAPAEDPSAGRVTDDEHSRRAASFGAAARAYAEHRPDYPLAAIRWALEPAAGQAGHPVRILDLGAGTGKLTAQLAGLALDGGRPNVLAVEPDPHMLAELRGSLHRWSLQTVTAVAGRAECIPLPDESVDAVLAGQAAHWFDVDRAMPEIFRVLTPGGVFAGLWNADDDRVGWVAGLHQASGRRGMVARTSDFGDDDGISAWLRDAGRGLFSPPEGSGFEHSQLRSADSLIATMRTHSMFLIMEPADREAVLSSVRDYLAATPQTASGEFSLPIWTIALRSVKRPGSG